MTGKMPDPENHVAKGFRPPQSWALPNRRLYPLHPGWFCTRQLVPDGSPGRLASSLGAATFLRPCSFGRDSNARVVPVTPPIVLKLQGLPARKSFAGRAYHCCPRSPRLTCSLACAEDGPPRVTHERFFGRHLRGSSARSAQGPGRSSRAWSAGLESSSLEPI